MKKLLAVLAAVVTLAAIGVTAAVSSGDGRAVVKFDTMAPVVPPYTGPTNSIRGVNGGGVAWKLESAQGRLRADGRLDIEVEGLVLVSTGVNPSPTFSGVVSCLSSDATGAPTVNVSTDPVPATMTGNAEIDAKGGAAVAVLRSDRLRDVGRRQLVRGHRPLEPPMRVGSPGQARPGGSARA